MAGRFWLDVPFSQKEAAKAAGARWDQAARRWYAPRPDIAALRQWTPRPPVPDLLPGEDRALGRGLFVDMVPSSCWFTNVRSCVSETDWERVRRMVTRRAGNRCEACGAPEDRPARRWLEVHERWRYDDVARVQHLGRLICLCSDCHGATHFGLAGLRGKGDDARTHLMGVTGMSKAQVEEHLDLAWQIWEHRSRFAWALDLSVLTGAGITVAPAPSDRAGAARSGLDERRP